MATLLTKIGPTAFQRFFRAETVSSLLMFGFAGLALPNSPFAKEFSK